MKTPEKHPRGVDVGTPASSKRKKVRFWDDPFTQSLTAVPFSLPPPMSQSEESFEFRPSEEQEVASTPNNVPSALEENAVVVSPVVISETRVSSSSEEGAATVSQMSYTQSDDEEESSDGDEVTILVSLEHPGRQVLLRVADKLGDGRHAFSGVLYALKEHETSDPIGSDAASDLVIHAHGEGSPRWCRLRFQLLEEDADELGAPHTDDDGTTADVVSETTDEEKSSSSDGDLASPVSHQQTNDEEESSEDIVPNQLASSRRTDCAVSEDNAATTGNTKLAGIYPHSQEFLQGEADARQRQISPDWSEVHADTSPSLLVPSLITRKGEDYRLVAHLQLPRFFARILRSRDHRLDSFVVSDDACARIHKPKDFRPVNCWCLACFEVAFTLRTKIWFAVLYDNDRIVLVRHTCSMFCSDTPLFPGHPTKIVSSFPGVQHQFEEQPWLSVPEVTAQIVDHRPNYKLPDWLSAFRQNPGEYAEQRLLTSIAGDIQQCKTEEPKNVISTCIHPCLAVSNEPLVLRIASHTTWKTRFMTTIRTHMCIVCEDWWQQRVCVYVDEGIVQQVWSKFALHPGTFIALQKNSFTRRAVVEHREKMFPRQLPHNRLHPDRGYIPQGGAGVDLLLTRLDGLDYSPIPAGWKLFQPAALPHLLDDGYAYDITGLLYTSRDFYYPHNETQSEQSPFLFFAFQESRADASPPRTFILRARKYWDAFMDRLFDEACKGAARDEDPFLNVSILNVVYREKDEFREKENAKKSADNPYRAHSFSKPFFDTLPCSCLVSARDGCARIGW